MCTGWDTFRSFEVERPWFLWVVDAPACPCFSAFPSRPAVRRSTHAASLLQLTALSDCFICFAPYKYSYLPTYLLNYSLSCVTHRLLNHMLCSLYSLNLVATGHSMLGPASTISMWILLGQVICPFCPIATVSKHFRKKKEFKCTRKQFAT